MIVARSYVSQLPFVGVDAQHSLPDDTTRATRARIAEVFEGVAVSEVW